MRQALPVLLALLLPAAVAAPAFGQVTTNDQSLDSLKPTRVRSCSRHAQVFGPHQAHQPRGSCEDKNELEGHIQVSRKARYRREATAAPTYRPACEPGDRATTVRHARTQAAATPTGAGQA